MSRELLSVGAKLHNVNRNNALAAAGDVSLESGSLPTSSTAWPQRFSTFVAFIVCRCLCILRGTSQMTIASAISITRSFLLSIPGSGWNLGLVLRRAIAEVALSKAAMLRWPG